MRVGKYIMVVLQDLFEGSKTLKSSQLPELIITTRAIVFQLCEALRKLHLSLLFFLCCPG